MMNNDVDVFISYAHENADFASKFFSVLSSRSLKVWLDQARLLNGFFWKKEIDQNLDKASLLVVIVSPASMDSAYVTYEWCRAWLKNQTDIYWIYFQDCSLQKGMITRLTDDFQFPFDKCLEGRSLDSSLELIGDEIQTRLQSKSSLVNALNILVNAHASTEEKVQAAEILGDAQTHAIIACNFLLEGMKMQLTSRFANGNAQTAIAGALQKVGDLRAIPYLLRLRQFTSDEHVQRQVNSTLDTLVAKYT